MAEDKWNVKGLRGSVLEELINYTNEKYRQQKLALVQKIPTSIKPVRFDKTKRHITLAYFDQKLSLIHILSTVRDEIMDAQDSFRKKSNLVSEILHTMQNLYKVANRHEVLKIQDEFYKIYETGDMERLEHFNKQLDIIAEGYRAQSIS